MYRGMKLGGGVVGLVRRAIRHGTVQQEPERPPIPVTILSGYLGSGKTTLLNALLSGKQHRGKRIAVVMNEFGSIPIDDSLVAHRESVDGEDIFHTTTGCLCCTVRSDLLPVLSALFAVHHCDPLDALVVETTGLASLNPVLQTFLRDPAAADLCILQSVVTLVDALHGPAHLARGTPEFLNQLAYADRVVVNKTDLVAERHMQPGGDHEAFLASLRQINPLATFSETALRPGGSSSLQHGDARPPSATESADASPSLAAVPPTLELFSQGSCGGGGAYDLSRVRPSIDRALRSLEEGHVPTAAIDGAAGRGRGYGGGGGGGTRGSKAAGEGAGSTSHAHDGAVEAVCLEVGAPLLTRRVERWLGSLLADASFAEDLLRLKGLLRVVDDEDRAAAGGGRGGNDSRLLAVQAVHMSYQGDFLDSGAGDTNDGASRLLFIGRGLCPKELAAGLTDCIATTVDVDAAAPPQVRVLTNRHVASHSHDDHDHHDHDHGHYHRDDSSHSDNHGHSYSHSHHDHDNSLRLQ